MLIGVAAVVLGGFIIICAAPFTSPRLYKTGGGLFLVSGTAKGASPTVVKYTYSDTGRLGLTVYLCITWIFTLQSQNTLDLTNSRKWCISFISFFKICNVLFKKFHKTKTAQ